MQFHEKLARLAEQQRRSQRNVARALQQQITISVAKVNEWFLGKREPSLREAWLLARLFGVPLEYLADDTQDEPAPPELDPEERILLQAFRRLGISVDEGILRLGQERTSPRAQAGTADQVGDTVTAPGRLQRGPTAGGIR
ncbi:MAG: helix-turn-helix transcriptional regulator [Isosphaeraceae bacterium]|nr:helix-turn-helix transcriptional regulator [Isosphaeraceae bacterium]